VAVSDAGSVAYSGTINTWQIHVVAPGAHSSTQIGRTGAGPGEYQSVLALGFTPSGTLRAFDLMQRRVIEYTSAGTVIATSAVPMPLGFVDASFAHGQLVMLAAARGSRVGDSANVALYAADTGVRTARRIQILSARQRVRALSDLIPIRPPFSPQPQWSIAPGGSVVYSDGALFAFDAFDSLGVHTHRVGFAVVPRRVTTADLDRWRTNAVRGLPAHMQAAIRNSEGTAAPKHAAITRIRALANGEVWVRETESEAGDSTRWVVFGPDLVARGTVVLGAYDDVVGSYGTALLISEVANRRRSGQLRWYTRAP
jgi:hypothetical protein